jgi:hypothetical protein
MKKFRLPMIIAIILTFGFIQNSNAQKQSTGLYLTYTDFLQHKLSYGNMQGSTNKLIIHEFLGESYVTVITNGKKQKISKSGLFGYRDANNNDYRFYDSRAYQIIDTAGFYMYSFDKLVQQGKGPKPTRIYFFSKRSDSEILPLNSDNIAQAFPANQKFKFMVEVESKSAIKLDEYDNSLAEYKIKELYTESLK